MKNFSDLLATKADVTVEVELSCLCGSGNPHGWIIINDHVCFDSLMLSTITITKTVSILSCLTIEIGMKDKIYSSEQETAIVIEKLNIDGFEIIPNWNHLARYENDHKQNSPTRYLGFNGRWILEIDRPFYQWQHQITSQGWLLEPSKI
jgi:hypothetical protein